MALVALLIVGLGLLVGLALLPTITIVTSGTGTGFVQNATYIANPNYTVYTANPIAYNGSSLNTLAAGTPLVDIVHLLAICFLGIVILGAIWAVSRHA